MTRSAKNMSAGSKGSSHAAFLTQWDVQQGYADAIKREPWPHDASRNYEWGRYLGAEVAALEGEQAPTVINIKSRVTKEWLHRMARCTAFQSLVRQHYSRTYATA